MLEKEIEKKLIAAVDKMGGLCWKFVSPGTAGVPDRVCILQTGKVIFVELKAKNGISSKIQSFRCEQLRKCKADVRVIKGEEELKKFIEELRAYAIYST